MNGVIVAVAKNGQHAFSKTVVSEMRLIEGLGVEGDAHAGTTVKHRSRVARDPTQANLRQVHLLQMELLDELQANGYQVVPGALGENVTTSGVDLPGLPEGNPAPLWRARRRARDGSAEPVQPDRGFSRGTSRGRR